MTRPRGHWFCDHCENVISMTDDVAQTNVRCRECGHAACNFISYATKTIVPTLSPAEWFAAMRRVVAEATNPELPDLQHHK